MLIIYSEYLAAFPHYELSCFIFSFQALNSVSYRKSNLFLYFHFRLAMRMLVVNYVILVIFLYTLFFIILTNKKGLDEVRIDPKVKRKIIYPGSKSDKEEQSNYIIDENIEKQIFVRKKKK